ncbi:hypothetical protein CYY_005996 [Polysphondylium violaceum]|uniref:Sugar phosphate transporter domain-containing protein n=1 Tax=Polysphondylium violaceum TaxID=133409 RepID=A0A8J4UYF9_9MYCE|nr:hypothetical protein CYY_005996 [Polysphondylium violaceum]
MESSPQQQDSDRDDSLFSSNYRESNYEIYDGASTILIDIPTDGKKEFNQPQDYNYNNNSDEINIIISEESDSSDNDEPIILFYNRPKSFLPDEPMTLKKKIILFILEYYNMAIDFTKYQISQIDIKNCIQNNKLLLLWMFINLSIQLINQYLEEYYSFNYTILLVIFQLFISFIVSWICIKYSINPTNQNYGHMNKLESFEIIYIMMPFSCLYCINIVLSVIFSESIIDFSKSMVPLTTILFQHFFTKDIKYEKRIYFSIICLVFGTGIFIIDGIEPLAHFKQFLISFIIINFISLNSIYSHRLFSTKLLEMNPMLIIYYFAPCSIFLLSPFYMYYEHNLLFTNSKNIVYDNSFYYILIFSGIIMFFTYFTTFISNKKYNLLVMSISRNSKSILLKCLSSQIIEHHSSILTFKNIIGFLFSFIGVFSSYQKPSPKEHNDGNQHDQEIMIDN